jgi:hypothetical protein
MTANYTQKTNAIKTHVRKNDRNKRRRRRRRRRRKLVLFL